MENKKKTGVKNINMVEVDFIAFAGVAFLLLHAFNSILPQKRPGEFRGEEISEGKPVSTV